jgi:hypothetical protein
VDGCYGKVMIARRAAVLPALLVAACQVHQVAPYDAQFVRDAVALQTDFAVLTHTLRNPPPGTKLSYSANKAAYNRINADLDVLATQAGAQNHNAQMIEEVQIVTATIQEMQATHRRTGHLAPDYVQEKAVTVDQQIGILIRSENDKRALK